MAFHGPFRTASLIYHNTRPNIWRILLNCQHSAKSKIGTTATTPLRVGFSSFRNPSRIFPESYVNNNGFSQPLNRFIKSFLSRYVSSTRCQSSRSFKTGGTGGGSRGAKGSKSSIYYISAIGVVALGLSYAAVPLYRMFCQAYSYGGTIQEGHNAEGIETMEKVKDRVLKVRFNADTTASMTWNFKPQQHEIKVVPGETALAFYTARNPTDRPVIGVSTYNVIPFDAGQYFNKIQCFCFEEQLLNPHEEVHMPVFFYIDPEFVADPKMENIDILTLSYTFFEVREGVQIPIPNFAKK